MHRFVFVLLGCAVACSSEDGDGPIADFRDAGTTDADAGQTAELSFVSTVIEGLGSSSLVGDNAVIAIGPSGQPAVAYGRLPVGSTERQIRYAFRNPDGTWTAEEAARPGANSSSGDLVGLGFAFVDGVPHLAYLGGDGDEGVAPTAYPYPTDLMLSTRAGGTWTEQATPLADRSSDAPGAGPNCLQNVCNEGFVVGSHAAIAASAAGFVVGYRDQHFGFGDDSFLRSDVELFGSGITPTRSVVDVSRSGGAYIGIALTTDDRPVLAYNVEVAIEVGTVGVWASVWRNDDWVRRKLGDGLTSSRTAVAAAPDGTLYVAYYDVTLRKLVLATSTDDGDSWSSEQVETSGIVGIHPAITLDAQGQPVIAYGYCGPASEITCPGTLGANAEVRLARRAGNDWDITVVDDGQGFGGVGRFNSIAIAPDGAIYIAFQDERNSDLLVAEAQP